MTPDQLTLVSAAFLSVAAGCCLSLAAAIYRRAAHSAEITTLVLTLSALGADYLLRAGVLLAGTSGSVGVRKLYLLAGAGFTFRVIFFAGSVHFLALSLRGAGGSINEPSSTLYFPLNPHRALQYWTMIVFIYGTALTALGFYAYFFVESWPEYAAWASGEAPDPIPGRGFYPHLLRGPPLVFYPAVQLGILAGLYIGLSEHRKRGMRLARQDSKLTGAEAGRRWERWGFRSRSAYNCEEEWKAFLVPFAGSVGGAALWMWADAFGRAALPPRVSPDLVLALIQLLVLLPLVYYKSRLVFFDVLIKRGALVGALLASSALFFAVLLPPVARSAESRVSGAGTALVWAGGALFTLAWVAGHGRLARALDRGLFRRPDYARLVLEIGQEMRRHDEPARLISAVASQLERALGAAHVRFVEQIASGLPEAAPGSQGEVDPAGARGVAAAVPVATDERWLGHLIFGERPRGQIYQSEDLSFLLTVGNQLAETLANFALREERRERELREAELRELTARAELRALRAQINPHFLFNALGTLAHLARNDPRAAERTVHDLAETFRFALDASREERVRLGAEIDFLTAYLAIERARFGDRLSYEFRIPERLRGLRLPPMLIQPLVENAVRHGLSLKPAGGGDRQRRVAGGLADGDGGRRRSRLRADARGGDPEPRVWPEECA